MAKTSAKTSTPYPNSVFPHSSHDFPKNLSNDCGLTNLPPDALALVADFFKILSEVSRLQIVCTLRGGSKNVSQIINSTGLGQANVSKHLKLLTQAGILNRSPKGVTVYYEIANPMVFPLCELVCNSLTAQMHNQNQQIAQLQQLQQHL